MAQHHTIFFDVRDLYIIYFKKMHYNANMYCKKDLKSSRFTWLNIMKSIDIVL